MISVAAGVLVDSRGRVLLAQRPAGKHLAGLWEFPGGKLETGETPDVGLARELHEELGVVVEADEPLVELPWAYGNVRLHFYVRRVIRWKGEPAPLEHQGLQWIAPAHAYQVMLTPADRHMLQLLPG